MPFHIFFSQWLSTATGGLEVWKIAKDIVLLLLVLFTVCLVFWQGKADRVFKLLFWFSVLYGALHLVLWWTQPDLYFRSAAIGTIYNMRLPLFALLGYGAVRLLPKFVFSSVLKLVLVVSTLVAALGILQYFLPPDVMTHFGYSLERGARPFFLIDTNAGLIRIMSTLREPNALGAYLILPSAALLTLCLKTGDSQKRLMLSGALGLHLLAVFLTFSRSAWLGLGLSLSLVLWWQHKGWIKRTARRFWPLAAGAALLLICAGIVARNASFTQQYVLHNNPTEQIADIDSNQYHSLLLKEGLVGAARDPLGHGPGTAGLASIQNPAGGQLTENYYVQIAYELGAVGALLFIMFNIWLYVRIRRRGDYVATILLASFWGYIVTNMLLHTWSNEAVTAQWWLLAGMALALGTTFRVLPAAASKAPPKRA
jgi:hypothetical protein